MIRYIFILLFLNISLKPYAQFYDIIYTKSFTELTQGKFQTGGYFDGFTSSESINNKFVWKLYHGTFLDSSLKNSNKLNIQNFVGLDANSTIFYNALLKNQNLGYHISVSHRISNYLNFSKEAYNIVFFGNKLFAGETADLSGLTNNYTNYYKTQLGLFSTTTQNNKKYIWFAGISLLNGLKNYMLSLNNAAVYTHETGEYIDIIAQGKFLCTDTTPTQWNNISGYGGALDLSFCYETDNGKFSITTALFDLGFILWNKKPMQINFDTTYHFEGITFDNILQINQSKLNGISMDSLLNEIFFSKIQQKSYSTATPTILACEIEYKTENKSNISYLAGMNYVLNSFRKSPVFYGRYQYHINQTFRTDVQLSFAGSIRDISLGIGIRKTFFSSFNFQIGSNNIFAFLFPANTYSQNIGFSIIKKFSCGSSN